MPTHNPDSLYRPDPARWAGVGITVAAHALILASLISQVPARKTFDTVAPLMVHWIQSESPIVPAPIVDKFPEQSPKIKVQPGQVPESPTLAVQASASAAQAFASAAQAFASAASATTGTQEPGAPAPVETRVAQPMPSTVPVAPVVPPDFTARYLDNPAPAYPPLARRLGEEGKVMLRVHVEVSGLPSKVEIRNSSGSERLDHAALEAVKRWKFVPARQGEMAVPAAVVVPIAFSLGG